MGIISLKEVGGYLVNKEVVCRHCIQEKEFLAITEDVVLSIDYIDKDDTMYFCDRCKERL